MKKSIYKAVLLAIAVSGNLAVNAQSDEDAIIAKFNKMDTNNDGFLQMNEFNHHASNSNGEGKKNFKKAIFGKMDRNADNRISLAEYKAYRRSATESANNGNKGGNAKANNEARKAFNDADSDGDGFLSFAEFRAIPGHKGKKRDQVKLMFEARDKDGDKKLSLDEYNI